MKKITLLILITGFVSLISCVTDDETFASPNEATDNFENVIYSKDGDELSDTLITNDPLNPNDGDPPPKEIGGNGHRTPNYDN